MAPNLKINIEPILKLALWKRVLILVGISVAIIAAGYWFLIAPARAEVASLKNKLATLEVTLNENRVIAADIPKYRKEKEEMEARLKKAVAQLPNEKEIPDLIDAISNAGEEAGLKIMIFKPGAEIPKGFYAEVPVSMSVTGRYESLYDFSVKIANLPRIVNISGLNVLTANTKGKTPILSANFTATTFRFIPTPQQGK